MEYGIIYIKNLLEHWYKNFWELLPKLFFATLIFICFILIGKFVRNISYKFSTKLIKKNPHIVSIISSTLYFIILVFGIIVVLEFIGLDKMVAKVLTGAGILGIIVGFAFKDIASNLFAGMLLKLQGPFSKKDWVEIGSVYGEVLEVGWIMTRVHTITGEEVFIPNQIVYNNPFTNYTTFKKRMVILKTGVSYGDDLELVQRVALDEVNKMDIVLKDEQIDFYFTEIGGSSYNFNLRFWIKFHCNKDYLKAMNEIIIRIKKRFEKENISIAYPVTTLDFGVKGGINIFDKEIKITNTEKKIVTPKIKTTT